MCGDLIRIKRKELGLTQAQLAEKLYVSNKAVSKWETREANPDIELLPKIAEILGITVDELLGAKPKEKENAQAISFELTAGQKARYVLSIVFSCIFAGTTALFVLIGMLALDESQTKDVLATAEEQTFVITFSFVLAAVFGLCAVILLRKALKYGRLYAESRKIKLRIQCQKSGYKLFCDLTDDEKTAFKKERQKKSMPFLIVAAITVILRIVLAFIKGYFPLIASVIEFVLTIVFSTMIYIFIYKRISLMSKHKYIE